MTKIVPVGPFLHGKSRPGILLLCGYRTIFEGQVDPTRTGFDRQKRSGGPILCGSFFAVTVQHFAYGVELSVI